MAEVISKMKNAYFKMLKAYAKGKINKGKKWERKLLELELKSNKKMLP